MQLIPCLTQAMIAYYAGDVRRINHFLCVYGFAKTIAALESVDAQTMDIIEAVALTHDIGIKPSLEKYGSNAGSYQETEGPPVAKAMLESLGFAQPLIERVCWLIAHHHTYNKIEGTDYQILVEADFLVNIDGQSMSKDAAASVKAKIFKTGAGIVMLEQMYGV